MTAPEHIRDCLRNKPVQVADRDELLRQNWHLRTPAEIASALGVGRPQVYKIARRLGLPCRPKNRANFHYRGLHVGNLSRAILSMPPAAQDALERRCAKTGETLAEALAAAWVEARADRLRGQAHLMAL